MSWRTSNFNIEKRLTYASATQRPLASIARSMTVRLVNLFEMGFETVTTCRKAVEIFVEIKKKNVLATGLNFARLCFSAYNLGVVAELAADASITVPTSVGLAAGAQVIASLGQIAFCAYNAKQAHKEQQKWSKGMSFSSTQVLRA